MAEKAQGSDTKKSNDKMPKLELLGDYFEPADVEWRAQRSGYNANRKQAWVMVMPYITNRGVMARLDEACGPAGWRNEFKDAPGKAGGILCGISILIDGEWVTKWDGAENTSLEPVKGGISGSMKRAAVQWGIGRYLYMMETQYVEVKDKGQHYIKSSSGQVPAFKGYWTDPELPKWAVPGADAKLAPKNFKWKDPEDLEVSTPEIEEQRKRDAAAKANEDLKQKMATADRTPVAPVTPADKPPEQVTQSQAASDPRILEFQQLMHDKIIPEVREAFVDAIIGIPRPKTMGQIEMLIMMLKKRPDLPKTEDVVLDDIDDTPVTGDQIDAAMQEAMDRDKS